MSRRRKIIIAAGLALVVIAFLLCWPSPSPSYEGRSMEEWFKLYSGTTQDASVPGAQAQLKQVESAFKVMGTNTVSYLAGRITQDQNLSWLTRWRFKHRQRIPQVLEDRLPRLSGEKFTEGMRAAELLAVQIKPPGEMLLPLIAPAFQSTNASQRLMAFTAVRGISSGHALARPHLARGLRDSDPQVQRMAAMAVRWHGNATWAVSNLLEAAQSRKLDVINFALQALNQLGTNALPVIPKLKEMLAQETDAERRREIANAIDYISQSGR